MRNHSRSKKFFGVALGTIALAIVVQTQPVSAAKTSTSTQTAQSIWTNFKSSGSSSTFGYTDTETYAFNLTTAATWYVVTTTGPAVTCNGSTSNCAVTNQPATPAVPSTPSFPMDRQDECHFWAGTALTTVSETASKTVGGANGSGNWKFTWTFTWTPTAVPSARTAWDLTAADSAGGANVNFTGQIAGLSAQKTSKSSAPKYSFSMLNSDGTPRVSNVLVTVDGGTPVPVDSTVINALSVDANGISLFNEFSIGGSGSLSTLMAQGGTQSILTTGDARTILNTDSFAGNNNGGSTGASLAYAQLSVTKLLLTEGPHTVVLSATIKGIDGNANLSVSVTRDVRVQGLGGCA